MTRLFAGIILFLSGCHNACGQDITPPPPVIQPVVETAQLVPFSEIDVPVTINLQPLYSFAETYVDKEFNSEGWPNQWVYDGCNTRYMYRFRRGPLNIVPRGNTVDMDFTGYYQVKGSQRGCVGGVGITPWSPPCSCGFNEPERKVQIGFTAFFFVKSDYTLGSIIGVKQLKALDACEMCFFKTDITKVILNNIQPQLDSAKQLVERQLAGYNLRPYFQQLWDQLQKPYALAGYGHLYMQPELLRLAGISANRSQLQLILGLRARPLVSLEPPVVTPRPLPPLDGQYQPGGFNIYADAHLRYDSLNLLINRELAGTRIEIEKGLFKRKYVVIDNVELSPRDGENIVIKANISGTAKGVVYMTGKPVYDSTTTTLRFDNLDFDIKTRDFLVRTAAWLLDKKLTRRLREASVIDLKTYLEPLKEKLNKQLSLTLAAGITSTGQVQLIEVSGLRPQPDYLFVRAHAKGVMTVAVSNINF